eukprot:TRINITY_DN3034_c3_g1_i1.p1 TRINITY_DN3034_c3_g1~~TRINITY_DN3034_c3_g1_i1.p1  ORF type:complete len:763 (-),score=140.23 TRINITY_DN3034_c3_g1_i1:355-2643(-)
MTAITLALACFVTHLGAALASAVPVPGLREILAPTKGRMKGLLGDIWSLRMDTSAAEKLGFLPEAAAELSAQRKAELKAATLQSYEYMKDYARYRGAMQAGGYYTSGKGFQKVGMICLLLEKFFTADDDRTQQCAGWLAESFRCYYDPAFSKAQKQQCAGTSYSYYDGDWGGIASKYGWDKKDGNSDYGNVAYNDHHYHFGYFVVSAAILGHLRPAILTDALFVSYVNTLIRDTANPTSEDRHFPRFRTFDWFDLHSWSHGIAPMFDGKDQESTSEELNLLYGIMLWGNVTKNAVLKQLGATMLTYAANTVREFFLMKDGNPYHPEDFVKNHVTGIFLQGKVDYTTWFGGNPEHIHGIQMLPLSPALQLTRRKDFCQQEWDDILSKADFKRMTKPWQSVLLTGSIAMLNPEAAYSQLFAMGEGDLDGGLSRAWALYWSAMRPGDSAPALQAPTSGDGDASAKSLLDNVGLGSTSAPNHEVFPFRRGHPIHRPEQTSLAAPIATNKFWVNWVVRDGGRFPIYPMPYILSFGKEANSQVLQVAHSNRVTIKGHDQRRIKAYISPNIPDIYIGADKAGLQDPKIISEGVFGATVELKSYDGANSVRFPVFSGLAYISGHFSGGLTPKVSHPHGLQAVKKVKPGIWSFVNRRNTEYRVYVLDEAGKLADDSYEFDSKGVANKPLLGWVRVAMVAAEGDVFAEGDVVATKVALDASAEAVVTGCELKVLSNGKVKYAFEKVGPSQVLHWAFGHHVDLMDHGDRRLLL